MSSEAPSPQITKESKQNKVPFGHIISKYVRPANRPSNQDSAHVRSMREIAMQIMILNQDILDAKVPDNEAASVTMDLDHFLSQELNEILVELEQKAKNQGRELTEAEIIQAVSDSKVIELAHTVRKRVFDLNNQHKLSSTTDSM